MDSKLTQPYFACRFCTTSTGHGLAGDGEIVKVRAKGTDGLNNKSSDIVGLRLIRLTQARRPTAKIMTRDVACLIYKATSSDLSRKGVRKGMYVTISCV